MLAGKQSRLIEGKHGEKCNYAGELGIQATDALIGYRLVLFSSFLSRSQNCQLGFAFKKDAARNKDERRRKLFFPSEMRIMIRQKKMKIFNLTWDQFETSALWKIVHKTHTHARHLGWVIYPPRSVPRFCVIRCHNVGCQRGFTCWRMWVGHSVCVCGSFVRLWIHWAWR